MPRFPEMESEAFFVKICIAEHEEKGYNKRKLNETNSKTNHFYGYFT